MSLPSLVLSGLGLANPFVGQGVYAMRLIEALQRAEIDFRVVAPLEFTTLRDLVGPSQFAELRGRPPHSHELVAHPWRMNLLAAQVRRDFPHAVFHSPSPFWSLRALGGAVVTLHDCLYRTFRAYLGQYVVRRLLTYATERWATRAGRVLTDSDYSRDQLVRLAGIPNEKIHVLYPWVDERSFAQASPAAVERLRERLQLPERFWLYVGGFDYRKNLDLLLRAYAACRRSLRDVPTLVLAGRVPPPGDTVCDVRGTMISEGLGEHEVRLPGLIEHEDLPFLYRAASLLVYPSLMEGFGLPPAEAMAVGTPVLVSDCSSLREVVRRPECRFDPCDQLALQERLTAAHRDERAFCVPLPEEFRERFGIARYLDLVSLPRVER